LAKVIGPLHSTEARGRVNSLVYGTWRGIRFVKTYIAPVFKEPDCRIPQKERVAAAVAAWQGLSDTDRAAWHLWAQAHLEPDWSGIPLRLTGANWFIRCYTRILRVAGSPPAQPPPGYPPYPLATWTITQTDNNAHLVWTYPTQPEAHTYYVQILRQGPFSIGRQPDFHHASIVTHELLPTSPYDDPLTIGGKYAYWARVLDADTGLITPMLLGSLTFAAVAGLGGITGRCWDGAAGIEGILVAVDSFGFYTDPLGFFLNDALPPGDYTVTPAVWQGPWDPTDKPAHVVAGATTDVGDFLGPPT